MNKQQLEVLAGHIQAALAEGRKAADAVEDRGTCNMDRATLYLPGTREASLKAAGISGYKLGRVFALGAVYGQADKNTAGVKAVADYLSARGYDASVWYQMD